MHTHRNHELGKSDMVFSHSPNPAYMAVLDIPTYDAFLPDWDWHSLTARVARQMSQERIFAWGCPEYDLQVRITATAPSGDFRPVESISGFLTTSGRLCFASYDNLTMCAQFDDRRFPDHEDQPFTVDAGHHQIVVHCMFYWRHGQQFPDRIAEGDHYIIVISPADRSLSPKYFGTVPWVVL